jgi:hypothetical protein
MPSQQIVGSTILIRNGSMVVFTAAPGNAEGKTQNAKK